MNADLRFRLTPYLEINSSDRSFLDLLLEKLGEEALTGLWAGGNIRYVFWPIENGEDDSAFMVGDGTNFVVHLDDRMPVGMVIDFLLHELGHLHSWDVADQNEDHCDEFGKSFALLYRLYLTLYEETL